MPDSKQAESKPPAAKQSEPAAPDRKEGEKLDEQRKEEALAGDKSRRAVEEEHGSTSKTEAPPAIHTYAPPPEDPEGGKK